MELGRQFARFASGLACFLLVSTSSRAQQMPVQEQAAGQAIVNFAELARQEALLPKSLLPGGADEVAPPMPTPERPLSRDAVAKLQATAKLAVTRPLLADNSLMQAASPPLLTSVLGLDGNDSTVIPPDTNGAVGPNHIMVTLNSDIRITTRSGLELSRVSLSSFWAPTQASRPFDPRVLHDSFNNRWILSAVSDAQSVNSKVLIAVSLTGDPTGQWNLRAYSADPTQVNWGDFPTLGFNKKWIVLGVNLFTVANNSGTSDKLYILDKQALYAGGLPPAATFSDDCFSYQPATTLDNTQDAEYMMCEVNASAGLLRISSITGAIGSEVLNNSTDVSLGSNPWAFTWPGSAEGFSPQAGSTKLIDAGDARVMSLVYRNGSLWFAQTVFLPAGAPTRSAAQWVQASVNGSVQQFGRVDDPAGNIFYAYPSLAVNANNDVLLGYSSFSLSQFASASYAFHGNLDASGALRSDTLLRAGDAKYVRVGAKFNRWGDYSATVVDPVNDLDMWTLQEYAAVASGNVDRWSTWWGQVPRRTDPFVLMSGPSIDFGSVVLNTDGGIRTVTILNAGAAPLGVGTVNVNGGFGINSSCGSPLAQDASCLIQVSFKPGSVGPQSGQITFTSNATNSPHSIPVSGNGFDLLLSPSRSARPARNGANLVTIGAAAAIRVSLAVSGGFTGTVGLSYAGAPVGVSCQVSPAAIDVVAGEVAGGSSLKVVVSAAPLTRSSRLRTRVPQSDRHFTLHLNASFAGGTRTLELPVIVSAASGR